MSTTPITKQAPAESPHPAVISAAQASARPGELQYVPVNRIVPSTTNPRKRRNDQEDADLLASVKAVGVFQSVLLRPIKSSVEHILRYEDKFRADKTKPSAFSAGFGPGEDVYELVAGERRWEMAVRAGRPEVPAVIRKMDNSEAKQLQIIENLQRDDIDAIDEGFGFKALAAEGLTAKQISEQVGKVGKSERYVLQSMKRTEVIDELVALYREGRITISHIDVLSFIPKDAQKIVVTRQPSGYIPLFGWHGPQSNPLSVRELKQWIQQNIYLSLDAAPFRKDDPKLLPKAGACTDCQKNTAVNPHIDPEAKHATCTDRQCFQEKQQAHLVQIQKAMEAAGERVVRLSGTYGERPTKNNDFIPKGEWTEVKKGSCSSQVMGVIIDGPYTGQKVATCVDKKCKVHNPSSSRSTSSISRPNPAKQSPAQLKKEADAEKKRQLDKLIDREAEAALIAQIAKKAGIDRWLVDQLVLDACQIDAFSDGDCNEPLMVKVFGLNPPKQKIYDFGEVESQITKKLEAKPSEQFTLGQMAALLIIASCEGALRMSLEKYADHYKLDPKKIRKDVMERIAAEEKKKSVAAVKAAQTSAPIGKSLAKGKAKAKAKAAGR
ncbi:MAG TPA: ParB/RepB/Spo0J family partition protein [Terriglobales bacterium]|nr:ParB/RepB/Spo0J family partition protein [Terriglobales bacterium]